MGLKIINIRKKYPKPYNWEKSIIIIINFFFFYCMQIFTPVLTSDFQWSLTDIKSPQISRTKLSILADLNSAVVWVFSILSLQIPQCLFKFLGTVPNTRVIYFMEMWVASR